MAIPGEVVELWRYPAKSLLGESCEAIELDRRGVRGDRLYAVHDADGKIGSGKNTRRFRKIDGLLALQAMHSDDQIPEVKFPNGQLISVTDIDIDVVLSDFLGKPVKLLQETDTSYLDAGPVHFITRDWLARLQDIAPKYFVNSRRFRPNIVLSTEGCLDELAWLGRHIRIGSAELKITAPTERCGMVALPQGELPNAPNILRHISQELGLNFGVYAEVIKSGVVRLGDEIREIDDER